MNSKERIRSILAGEPADRMGKADAPWPHTRERWRREGAPNDVHVNDHFAMDIRRMVVCNGSLMLEDETLDENEDATVVRNADATVMKIWKDQHASPGPVEFGIRSRADWEKYRERLVPSDDRYRLGYYGDYQYEYDAMTPSRIAEQFAAQETLRETFVPVSISDPYEATMARCGDERLLKWMIDDPDLVTEMFDAHAELGIGMLKRLLDAGAKPDGIFCGGDVAYKNGPQISPRMYRRLLKPYHKKMFDFYRECGLKIIYHSDGDVRELLGDLIDAGIDCIEPLEFQAGMDLDELAEPFGKRVSFMGNLSAIRMSGTRDQAVADARRCLRAGRKLRGYILHSDHSVPPTVSWENFQAIMEVFDEEAHR